MVLLPTGNKKVLIYQLLSLPLSCKGRHHEQFNLATVDQTKDHTSGLDFLVQNRY